MERLDGTRKYGRFRETAAEGRLSRPQENRRVLRRLHPPSG